MKKRQYRPVPRLWTDSRERDRVSVPLCVVAALLAATAVVIAALWKC